MSRSRARTRAPSPPSSHAPLTRQPRVAVVVSRYNWTVTGALLDGARQAFADATGCSLGAQCEFFAPGAFELVPLAFAAADGRTFDGVVALGCIIKGQTQHDEVLGHAVTQALANISLVTGVPVTLGVLTVRTAAQAVARAGGKRRDSVKDNKGYEAMSALLATLAELARLGPAQPRHSLEVELPAQALEHLAGKPMPTPPDKLKKGTR